MIDRQALRALRAFESDYRQCNYNMPVACESFLDRAGYRTRLQRSWQDNDGAILFIASHSSMLDGFAISLACPRGRDLRRVIFSPTGRILGRHFARRNVLVWPRVSWHSLWQECGSLKERLNYFFTHRWGPAAYWGRWARAGQHVEQICELLRGGSCVSLLPAGVVGDAPWRSGIGAILCDYAISKAAYRTPLYVAPVYIDWRSDKRVEVETPGLVSADTLLTQLQHSGTPLDRRSVTHAIEQAYQNRDWPDSAFRAAAA
jgi:hypothetical protein